MRTVFTDTAVADQAFRVTDKNFSKYKNVNPFFGRKRTRTPRIYAPEEDKNKQTWIIPKSPEPGPGSYKIEDATKRTQWPHVYGSHKHTAKNVCFVDAYKKLYIKFPGAGKYDADDKVHHRLAKDTNFRYLRH